ncbi:MAG: hypothetical protein BM556_03295 [Bacteriovorax sp. MedPE-SWde]|nr:MAG: hypothetical protein BM556_03295 [Bacteriovorax sp. MedPE-SWde]
MKIAVINPPSLSNKSFIREGRCTQSSSIWSLVYPPLSLAQTASYIRENIQCEILGYDYAVLSKNFVSASDEIVQQCFDIVFIATGSPSIVSDIEFAKKVKESSPNTKIVLIGTHVTQFASELINRHSFIDIIIHNEPEQSALDIVKSLSLENSLTDILGISTRDYSNKESNFIPNLDLLPFPAWDLFDLSKYTLPIRGKKFLMISPQRGCPWKCTFCTAPLYYGNKIRSKSTERIRQEIEYIKSEYKVNNFLFWSDTFTANSSYVKELCDSIEDLDISWVSNSRVDTITPDLALAMSKSGCWLLTYGIESLQEDVLSKVKKGFTTDSISSGVAAAQNAGIQTIGHFIVGLPGDNISGARNTFSKAIKLNLDYMQFYYASPFPGTELYNDMLASGEVPNDIHYSPAQSTNTLHAEYKKTMFYIKMRTLIRFKTIFFILKNLKIRFS